MNVYSGITQNIMSLLFLMKRITTRTVIISARYNYHALLMKALRNRESFLLIASRRPTKLYVIHCWLEISFAFTVEPRANLRLSEMLLEKFRVAAAEAGSFMRAYLYGCLCKDLFAIL